MFKFFITLVALTFLFSCGGDSITMGQYHGQYVFSEVDISQIPDKKLAVKPLAERGIEGIIDTDDELKTLFEWEKEATKEISDQSDTLVIVALQSDMMCQCAAFADLDYIPLVGMKNYEVDSIYKEKGVLSPNIRNIVGKVRKLINDLIFFDFETQRTWKNIVHKHEIHLYTKRNCKAYRAYLDVDETSYLKTLKGKADTEYEANRMKYYIKRGVIAIQEMPQSMRRQEYLNLLCQHYQARNNLLEDGSLKFKLRTQAFAAMTAAGENGELPQDLLDAAKQFDDAEAAQGVAENFEKELFSKHYFEILGLPYDSKQDERMLRKELATMCPSYLDFLEAQQKGILRIIKIADKTGLINQ